MWDAAEVVALVRIESAHMRGIGTLPIAVTEHHAVVLRVFKGSVQLRSAIDFEQSAGDLELPDKIIRVAQGAPLQAECEYVVFLRTWPAAGAYSLVGDRAGAFKIVSGRVEPQCGGPVADDHRNLSERRFFDELDRLATHGISNNFPVVRRPSRSRCACAASASAYSLWTRTVSLPASIIAKRSPARCSSSARVAM